MRRRGTWHFSTATSFSEKILVVHSSNSRPSNVVCICDNDALIVARRFDKWILSFTGQWHTMIKLPRILATTSLRRHNLNFKNTHAKISEEMNGWRPCALYQKLVDFEVKNVSVSEVRDCFHSDSTSSEVSNVDTNCSIFERCSLEIWMWAARTGKRKSRGKIKEI